MTGDIGQRFLYDAINGGFQNGGQALFGQRNIEFHLDLGLVTKAVNVPFKCGPQAKIIEHSRTQLKRQLANGAKQLVGDGECFRQSRGLISCGFQLEAESGEELPHLVVKLACDGMALVFLNAEEAIGQRLKARGVFFRAALGSFADSDLCFQITRAIRDLIGERAIEFGEFRGEAGVESLGVGAFQRVIEGENEFGQATVLKEKIVVRTELKRGDTGLA